MGPIRLTRRAALAGLGLAAFGRAAPGLAGTASPGPPIARRDSFAEELWGRVVPDPYRWMENEKDPDWLPYLRGQSEYARRQLDAIPGRRRLAAAVQRWSRAEPTVEVVRAGGGRLLYVRRLRDDGAPALVVRETPGAGERVLLDPSRMQGTNGLHVSIDWWYPSPTGRYVVVGLSEGGSEQSVAHLVDADSGALLPERLDRATYGFVSWAADGSGFFLMRLAPGRDMSSPEYMFDSACWFHRVDTDPREDVLVLDRNALGVPVERFMAVAVRDDGGSAHVLAQVFYGGRDNLLLVAPRADVVAGRAQWRILARPGDGTSHNPMANNGVVLRGEDAYLIVVNGTPNGRVVRTRLASPDLGTADVVLEEGSRVVESLAGARDGLYVQLLDGGYAGLQRMPWSSRSAREVALPVEGTVLSMESLADDDGVILTTTSWLSPHTSWRFDPGADRFLDLEIEDTSHFDLRRFSVRREFVTVRDGTRVPLSLIVRRDAVRDGRNPALVNAYGAAQLTNAPRFDARLLAFLEAGGLAAVAHVRGGGEYGVRWAEGGSLATKPNTWRDLIDCCEWLVRERWTSPAHLAINGASGGGIAVGRAMTERPQLFAAVVPEVGVLNTLRFEFTANGAGSAAGLGSVRTEEGFRHNYAIDSYQHVVEGTRYPAVLLLAGANDLRVAAWQSAKMCAALQHATASGRPVLMLVDFAAGHGYGSTRGQRDQQATDMYAFVLAAAGHRGFVAR